MPAFGINTTHGAVYTNPLKPSVGASNDGLINVTLGIELQFTWTEKEVYTSYDTLKLLIEVGHVHIHTHIHIHIHIH
jgi:hypothetical protein